MTNIYTKQLEDENEKLRNELVKAQETIDYYCATWSEEINGSEVTYKLCLGNFCVAVIVNPFMCEYRCHVIKLQSEKWYWSDMFQAITLEQAKSSCEYVLGFGKKISESTPLKDLKEINGASGSWMIGQMGLRRSNHSNHSAVGYNIHPTP